MHRATAPGSSAATEGGPHFTRFATKSTIQAHAVRACGAGPACGRPLMQVVMHPRPSDELVILNKKKGESNEDRNQKVQREYGRQIYRY